MSKNTNNLYNILNTFNKLNESAKPAEVQPKAKTLLESNMEQVLSEKYMGFKKTVAAIKKGGSAENPEAVAAAIGRKKYGKKAFQKAAAAGKKMGEAAEMEAMLEGMFGGVDHSNVAANLSKLAKVIKSVQTPEQFAVAQKYAKRMAGTIMKHQHDNMGFGSGMRANIGLSNDIQKDLKAKAAELGIDYKALEEGFPTVADARKQAEKEKGTGKYDKKKISTGTVYTRKYDPKSGETEDDGKDGEGKDKEKRGRGRPKKTNESHATIDKMVAELFESTMPMMDNEQPQLSYEQDHLKQHLGNHLYKKLEDAMKLNGEFPDDLYDNLFEYYLDEMPYGTAKARTGDPMLWIKDKLATVFPQVDEGRVVPRGSAFAPEMPSGQDIAPTKKPEGILSRAGRAVVGGINKAIGHGSDEELLQQLAKKKTMDEELDQLTKLAGMAESKKAKPDFLDVDKDGDEKESFKKAVKDKEKVDECMGMVGTGGEQEGSMNISTNMSTDGTKNVTITASGAKADELAQMLKLAGMGNGAPEAQEEPAGVATVEIGANDETEVPEEYEATPSPSYGEEEVDEDEMEEGNAFGKAVRDAKADGVQPGEKVEVGGKEYPVKEEEIEEDSRYEASTTPEEEVMPTQTLTKGGDGDVAGQEKKMNPNKPTWKNGDNAMSESISLKLMKEYESIKITK